MEIKNTIQFEDLGKLDIRLCKIVSCKKVENKDRLYELDIVIGNGENGPETRKVVSAIADRFTPEELIGVNFPFVLNLPPRKIAGIESEAMIVMSERKDGSYVKLSTTDPSDIGSCLFPWK